MQFFKKIFSSFKNNLTVVILSVLAALLVAGLIFQFVEYNSLNSAVNNKLAEKSGQRVVVDLQDKKWIEQTALNAEVVMEGVKFSADAEDEDSKNDDVVEDAEKLDESAAEEEIAAEQEESEDDAFSRKQREDAAKAENDEEKDTKKPVIKILDKPVLNESMAEISIIISNLGLNDKAIKSATALEGDFTMAFTPYGQLTTKASIQMAEEGRTVIAELPMQSTEARTDTGKFALSPTFDEKRNMQNFEAVYSIIPSAIGFMTPASEDFSGTGENEGLIKILKMIQDKNAAVIYQGNASRPVREFAAVNGLETIIPDLTIDIQPAAENIEAQLRALETIALERGSAVGIARPYPITFDILKAWQEGLAEKKIRLVSAVQR